MKGSDRNMVVWVIYLIDDQIRKKLLNSSLVDPNTSDINPGYCVYGYTTNKKWLKKFTEIHDMTKFIIKDLEMLDEEFQKFEDIYSYGPRMDLVELSYTEEKFVKLPLTSAESWACVDFCRETVEEIISTMLDIDWRIFNEEYRGIWKSLLYAEEYDSYKEIPPQVQKLTEPDVRLYTDEVTAYIRRYGYRNTLGLYLYLYNDILREDVLKVIL